MDDRPAKPVMVSPVWVVLRADVTNPERHVGIVASKRFWAGLAGEERHSDQQAVKSHANELLTIPTTDGGRTRRGRGLMSGATISA
jgi:hypothetical protein